ncbi:MaoC/PaaZ C-terminal domain-containing protein [Sediminitomix flava]|uniref:MaoC dehydratase-like protein n=1 Tax=Sediminitomix flava TaxID=379075 RepID=A0A315Z8H0_SEDFL|nr:MaoC/PaaZ C-terminal domain-containing protein [Sediminitomix flava]PWJ41046.1 MaoC dehydratase-like protein [Sediminitomix flava]
MSAHISELRNDQNLLFPVFKSLFTAKKQIKKDVFLSASYQAKIDDFQLSAYKAYFGFEQAEVPLPFLYLMAQKAQIKLMVEQDFPLAIPGMVHLENKMHYYAEPNTNQAFVLETTMEIKAKEGSLLPVSIVKIYQDNVLIADSESLYLSKRKSKGKKKKKEAEAKPLLREDFSKQWILHANAGKEYAEISGDKNPIHTSKIGAKLFGFPSMIIHGWCSASKATASLEKEYQKPIKSIEIVFKKAIVIPRKVAIIAKKEELSAVFEFRKEGAEDVYLEGSLTF